MSSVGSPDASSAGHRQQQVLSWVDRLADRTPRVALADGDDPRVLQAAAWLADHTSVRPLLVCEDGSARGAAAGLETDLSAVDACTVRSLSDDPAVMDRLRTRPDGTARPDAEVHRAAQDPVHLVAALVASGHADAGVAGAMRPTGDVIRAGLRVIGLAPGVSTVSSCFVMVLPDGRTLAYGDCAVLPTPDQQQLAQVAVATAHTYRDLTGEEPLVAMLSFSTRGSAEHPDVELVRGATALARELQPRLCIDGELQLDAALTEAVARTKAAGSAVAGRANVLVFPNLAAGNIGYKITERLAGAAAIGPILQGLAAPLNDLSRGCSSHDVSAVALLSAVQSLGGQLVDDRATVREPTVTAQEHAPADARP